MKKIIITAFLISGCLLGMAQQLIIYATEHKAGIYKTFEEFKYNNPSVPFHYPVRKKTKKFPHKVIVTTCKIDIGREDGNKIGKVFGFCDGVDVFINTESPELSSWTVFTKIEYFGKYCYYREVGSAYSGGGFDGTGGKYLTEKIIKIQTGENQVISTFNLEDLFADDPEYLAEYRSDEKRYKKLQFYLQKYLEKHKDDLR